MTIADDLLGYASSPLLAEGARFGRGLLERHGEAALRRGSQHAHLTAGGLVVDHTGTRALLIFHAGLDGWLQPGGHLEPGDASLRDAAIREVHEETGLPTRVLVEAMDASPSRLELFTLTAGSCTAHLDALFAARLTEPHPAAAGSAWFSLDALPPGVLPDLPPLLETLLARA